MLKEKFCERSFLGVSFASPLVFTFSLILDEDQACLVRAENESLKGSWVVLVEFNGFAYDLVALSCQGGPN